MHVWCFYSISVQNKKPEITEQITLAAMGLRKKRFEIPDNNDGEDFMEYVTVVV